MSSDSTNSLESLGPTELVGLVRRLIGEIERLREENQELSAALAALRLENQQLTPETAVGVWVGWWRSALGCIGAARGVAGGGSGDR